MKPLRDILADEHALVPAGFRALLREMGSQVVADQLSWGGAFLKADQVWERWHINGEGIVVGAIGNRSS